MQHIKAFGLAAALSAPAIAIPADIKARVEEGEGVPFFDERFDCREDGGAWSTYRELVEYGRQGVFDPSQGADLARELLLSLAERTANVSLILQCNVGVIAGYHLLARRYVAAGDDWRAYRLLQLALIYVFTLRNALRVPELAARDWATRTDRIVSEIKILKERLNQEQQRRFLRLPQVDPTTRVNGLRIAIVSICAYPPDHKLVLRNITPENRQAYGNVHGYDVHVHYEHPMPGAGVHIQHSKLQLVADYLRSGRYDWVAWFDCDSIIMNLNRTLDSVILRYARRDARFAPDADQQREEEQAELEGGSPSQSYDTFGATHDHEEPREDEVLETFVGHVGSCNSDAGCNLSTSIRVNPRVRYVATLRAALIDMEQDSEKLSSVVLGGQSLGECNPHPDNDFDCRLHNCFTDIEIPDSAVATGRVTLEAQAVRTHNDCHCSRIHGICYSAALAAFEEATDGDKVTDPRYGAFLVLTLTPAPNSTSVPRQPEEEQVQDAGSGCSCKTGATFCQRTLPVPPPPPKTQPVALRRRAAECTGPDVLLGISVSLPLCLQLCREVHGCRFVAYGVGRKRGQCHWEVSDCLEFEDDFYVVYDVTPTLSTPHLSPAAHLGCSSRCSLFGAEDDKPRLPDEGVDLLITEEGWGLSSANWVIRRSKWSIDFLERAFSLCHVDMPLFGDQDAMIHLLLNQRALSIEATGDPLDPHAVIVPQRELNAYDVLLATRAASALANGRLARRRCAGGRRRAFQIRQLGSSELQVTEPCLGTMTWGVQNSEKEAHEQLDYAVKERGVNFIDTAEMYPVPNFDPKWCPGRTEEYIGSWVKQNAEWRDKVVLASKVVGFWPKSRAAARRELPEGDPESFPDGRTDAKSIKQACDASLRRLQTDCIDLYQIHWPDRYVPLFGGTVYKPDLEREAVSIEETAAALKDLLEEGKIKAYGVSNETTFGICEWARAATKLDMPMPASIQNACSLVVRLFEYELAEACAVSNLNVGLLAYSILAGGSLSGKYRGGKAPENCRHTKFPNFMSRWSTAKGIPQLEEAIEAYAGIAEDLKMSLTELSTRWCRSRPYCGHGSVIIGATSMDQLKENLDAFEGQPGLSEEVLEKIDEVHLGRRNPGTFL
ncbi:unnamed protein product [Effrenium voratum]|nr:unnamed protein product [Effrenium voratum]